MKQSIQFITHLTGYSLRSVNESDLPALQRLLEKCADFTRLVEGTEVAPDEAEHTFRDGPPGKPLENKFIFGLFDSQGFPTAILEGSRDYPEEDTWWIGLLLLDPEVRGKGIGRVFVEDFIQYASSLGASAVMLGVVEDNSGGLAFWQRLGFSLDHKTEPRPFGKKTQVVWVMRREIPS